MDRAQAAQSDGRDTDAFNAYVAALTAYPSAQPARDALSRMLTVGAPALFDLAAVRALPPAELPFTLTSVSVADAQTLLLVHRPQDTEVERTDPQNNWPFDHSLPVYRAGSDSVPHLFCVIHSQALEDQALAARIGALLSLIQTVYSQRMRAPRADGNAPFHVWLGRQAPLSSGGEQWRNNIYFYSITDPRSSIEWIREVAHEYSHLAFSNIGGDYLQPEAWANGYLGERLLVRWLARAPGGAAEVERVWGGTFAGYANFERILIAPACESFDAHGVDKKWLARRDADGMRYVIGLVLTVDDRAGSTAVAGLLQTLADAKETDPVALYGPARALLGQSVSAASHFRQRSP